MKAKEEKDKYEREAKEIKMTFEEEKRFQETKLI